MRSPDSAFDLRAALTKELRAAADELDRSGLQPKGVHRFRVRLKRARALARVGAAGAPGLANVFNETARALMRTLSPLRDAAALPKAARRAAKRARKDERPALERVAEALELRLLALPPEDIEAVRTDIGHLIAMAKVWPEASPRQIARGAKRIAKRARAAWADSRGSNDAAHRHEWRKRIKDRQHAAAILGDAWPARRRLATCRKLGELLGRERDAALLLDLLEAAPALAGSEAAAAQAARGVRRRRKALAKRADALGRRLHAG